MTSLALLLLVRSEGESYGAAGLVVAVYAVALGIGAPIGGRQVDRYGPTRVLQIRAVLFAVFLAAVVALALLDAGIAAIAAAAAIAGFSMPPLSSTVRVVWPRLARDELRSTAYALEASLQEVHFIGGPLVAAALAAIEPVAAVAGSGLASLVGTTMVARLPPVRETPPSRSGGAGLLGALGSPGVRTIIGYAAVVGLAFGAVELAMPALAEEHGARELGGIALACFAAGSLVGGLLAGLRPADSDLRRFVGGAFVLSAAMLALQLAVSIPTLCLLAFVAGPADRADDRRALHAHRPLGARGHGRRGVRLVRHGRVGRHRRRFGDRRRPRRRARRPLVVRARSRDRVRRRRARLGAPGHAPGPLRYGCQVMP